MELTQNIETKQIMAQRVHQTIFSFFRLPSLHRHQRHTASHASLLSWPARLPPKQSRASTTSHQPHISAHQVSVIPAKVLTPKLSLLNQCSYSPTCPCSRPKWPLLLCHCVSLSPSHRPSVSPCRVFFPNVTYHHADTQAHKQLLSLQSVPL